MDNIKQTATVEKIKAQIAGAGKMARLHEIKNVDGDVIVYANICRGGIVTSASYRVHPDGQVSTHKINEYQGTEA